MDEDEVEEEDAVGELAEGDKGKGKQVEVDVEGERQAKRRKIEPKAGRGPPTMPPLVQTPGRPEAVMGPANPVR